MGICRVRTVLDGQRVAAVAVLDSGQEPPEVVEVGVTAVDGDQVGETLTWLVRPPHPIAPWATRAHGLRCPDVRSAPEAALVAPEIRAAVGDRTVVAHRGLHCHDLLGRALPDWAPTRVLDLRRLVAHVWPRTVSYALGALTRAAELRPHGTPGRAGHDSSATALLFVAAARRAGQPAEALFARCTVLEGRSR